MKKTIKTLIAGLLLVPILAIGVSMATPVSQSVSASSIFDGLNSTLVDGMPTSLFGGEGSVFKTITSVLLFLIGAISVLMLIYGGIRYTISDGDEKSIKAAKDTILYAVIGIIVALLAYAIVSFVLTSLVAS